MIFGVRRSLAISVLISSTLLAAQTLPVKPASRSPLTQAKPQEVFAPYWTSEPGWDTELQLKNNLAAAPLTVTPVLRLASGEEIPLDPVTIASNASVSVWVNEGLLKHAPSVLNQPGSFGSVVFRFTSHHSMNLYATAVASIQGQPIAFAIRAHPAPGGQKNAIKPTSLEGIWWQPRSGLKDILVIGNGSEGNITGTLSLFDAVGKRWSEPLSFGPRQTQRISLGDLLLKAGLNGSYGGIELQAASPAPNPLTAYHFMYDEVSQFSESLEMFSRDPNATIRERLVSAAKQWTLRAPTLALSAPDPAVRMPAGTTLQPTILVRNTTASKASANIALNWRGDSSKGQVKLPAFELAPFATQELQIGAMQKQLGIPDDARWALVRLTTSAAPDDLVAIASSRDASGRYHLDSSFTGGSGGHFAGGEWRADFNHNQLMAVTNSGQKSTNALLTLHYDNGEKSYEMQQAIQPGDQMWVNIAELIRSRTPDRKGNLLPVDLSYGTFDLRDLTPANDGLLISSVALDMTMGYNATQPCVECCGFLADSPTFDPYPAEVVVDGIEQTGIEAVSGCSDDTSYISSYFTTWGSLNSSIAAVTAKKVQGVSPGYTTGTAQGTIPTPGSCVCTFYAATPSEPVTVTPQITGISPPRGLIGSSLGVTISGSGFNSPSVSAGSGVSVTINSYTSTQIQATFAITSTASGGNQSVTVTSGGESSPSANFYVQIPETLVRDSGYGSSGLGSLVTITNGNVVDIYGNTLLSGECGVYRDIAYFLDDQEKPAQTIQGNYTLVENFTNYSTDVSGLTAPTTQDNPIVYAQTMLGDTQFFGTKASSGCPGANDHESFDQGFTVQIDSSHSYGLSMVNSISRGYYSGAATVNVTVITP